MNGFRVYVIEVGYIFVMTLGMKSPVSLGSLECSTWNNWGQM